MFELTASACAPVAASQFLSISVRGGEVVVMVVSKRRDVVRKWGIENRSVTLEDD